MERAKVERLEGASIISASQLLKAKGLPNGPFLLAFSEAEWKHAVGALRMVDGPVAASGTRVLAIRIPPDVMPGASIVAFPVCASQSVEDEGSATTCFPVYSRDPLGGLVIEGCDCRKFIFEPGPTLEPALPPPTCALVLMPSGEWGCTGSCPGGRCVGIVQNRPPTVRETPDPSSLILQVELSPWIVVACSCLVSPIP